MANDEKERELDGLTLEEIELVTKNAADLDFYDIALVRGFQVLAGAITGAVAAWLQSTYVATATGAQIAMRDSLFLAFLLSAASFFLTVAMLGVRYFGSLHENRTITASQLNAMALRDFIDAEGPYYSEQEVATARKKLQERKGEFASKVGKTNRFKKIWVALVWAFYFAIALTLMFVTDALWAAYGFAPQPGARFHFGL